MSVRAEIWSRDNTARRAILSGVTRAARTRAIGRDESLELEVAGSDPALSAIGRDAVLRLQTLGIASEFTLWRLARNQGERSASGALSHSLLFDALWMDLRQGQMRSPQADGSVLFGFGLVGLTPEQWIQDVILPCYDGDALAVAVGVVEIAEPVDLTFEPGTTPLAALRALEQASGGELQWRYAADGASCSVDLLSRVGQSQGGTELRYAKNLRGIQRVEDGAEPISRIYAAGGGMLTLADAVWEITGVAGTAAARVLTFRKSPVFEDGAFVGQYLRIGDASYLITASAVASGQITVSEGASPAIVVGAHGVLTTDLAGSRLAYLESPGARAAVGVRPGWLDDASDVPDATNLVANGDIAAWGAGLPTGWAKEGAPSVTRVDDPTYGKHGGTAARIQAAAAGEGLLSDPMTIPTGDGRRPYLGMMAGLTVVSGRVRLELRHSNGTTYPVQEQSGQQGVGMYLVLSFGPVSEEPLPAGTAQLAVLAHGGEAEWYLDCAMVAPQVGQDVAGFVRDSGAWVLWDRAVLDLQRRTEEVREYQVTLADLYAIDRDAYRLDELRLGDDVRVTDPDFGTETLRLVEITDDPLHPESTTVGVAPGPWQRPVRPGHPEDLFLPRYSPRRPGSVGAPTSARPAVLSHAARYAASDGLVHVDALGNAATATLRLYTRTSLAGDYPSEPAQSIPSRVAAFDGLAAAAAYLYYRIVPLDGRGVAGDAVEGVYDHTQAIRDSLAELDDDVHGAYRDDLITEAEAEALKGDLRRLGADHDDLSQQYGTTFGNPALEGAPKTALEDAWTDYDGAFTALEAAIATAIAADEDGVRRITSEERSAYEDGSDAYATALGVLAQRLAEAVDAISQAHAGTAGEIPDGSILAAKLAADAVTREKILNGAVNDTKLADAAVTAAKVAVSAINTAAIQDAAVRAQKIADGAVETVKVALGAINSSRLADAAVVQAKIADAAISTAKFAAGIEPVGISTAGTLPTTKSTNALYWSGDLYRWNGTAYVKSVPAADLAGSIVETQISNGAISTAKLAANAVTAAKIAAGTITATEIAANAITAAKIQAGAVSTSQLAAKGVTAAKIAAGTITADEIAAGTITGSNIAGLTITGANIAGTTITGAKLMAGTITATQIAAATITTSQIAANTITAANIAASAITGAKIAANTIEAGNIAAATITGAKIAGATITGSHLVGLTITGDKISANAITADKISVSTLSAITANIGTITAGVLKNSAGTFGISLNNLVNGVFSRYISFNTDDFFIKHEALLLDHQGNAWFKGTLEGVDGEFTGTVASTSFTGGSCTFAGGMSIGGSLNCDQSGVFVEGVLIRDYNSLQLLSDVGAGLTGWAERLSSDGNFSLEFVRNGPARFYMHGSSYNAYAVSGSWINSSDERLKTDLSPISEPVRRLRSLPAVRYQRMLTGAYELGWLAQSVRQVIPEAVAELEQVEGLQNVLALNPSAMLAVLWEAVREMEGRMQVAGI